MPLELKTVATVTEAEYAEHCRDYNGVCLECGDIRFGDTEPDAEKYLCEGCGKYAVMGFEQALLAGRLEIGEG